MFDPITLALIGGAVGGLTNKKDPLKGALLGAAGGYAGGGLLAPTAAGAAANGAAYTGTAAELAADGLGGVAMQPTGLEAGLLGVKDFAKQAKPVMDAAGTAAQVAQMTKQPPQAPIQHAQLMPSTPSPMFNNVMQNIMGKQQMDRAMEEQRKARRMQLIGGM